MSTSLKAENVFKTYNYYDYIINDFSYNFTSDKLYAITGNNGSGKSTLLKLLSGVLKPTKGKVTFNENHNLKNVNMGYCAPYMGIYEEFTPLELIQTICELKGQKPDNDYFYELIKQFKLEGKEEIAIRNFSSGMKQRVKLISAFITNPDIIFLDEPSSNLDKQGIKVLQEIIYSAKESEKLIIIASNEEHEINWCNENIPL